MDGPGRGQAVRPARNESGISHSGWRRSMAQADIGNGTKRGFVAFRSGRVGPSSAGEPGPSDGEEILKRAAAYFARETPSQNGLLLHRRPLSGSVGTACCPVMKVLSLGPTNVSKGGPHRRSVEWPTLRCRRKDPRDLAAVAGDPDRLCVADITERRDNHYPAEFPSQNLGSSDTTL